MTSQPSKRVAVIGGGISGLAAAYRLRELRPDVAVTLFEAGDRLGGVLDSVARDGYLFERSADGFITAVPWGVNFCKRVGLEDELMSTDESRRQAFVVCRGRLEPVPEGFIIMAPRKIGSVLTSRILSPWGKFRLGWEFFVPPRRDESDESVGDFVTRRLGREAYERLVQPLIGGIYTADPMQLSLAATMPQFVRMERDHGGLIRGAKRRKPEGGGKPQENSGGARYSMFAAPRRGFGSLVDAVRQRLPADTPRLNCAVKRLERVGEQGAWRVVLERGGAPELFDRVIVAAPAPSAAPLFDVVCPPLASNLAAIEYAGTAVVSVCYQRAQIRHALDGFGFVSPFIEKRAIIAGSFLSQKYAGRAPEGRVLIRAFVGGAKRPDLLTRSDAELVALVHGELADLLTITGEPEGSLVSRWERRMPQYHVGHLARVKVIEDQASALAGLALAGNAYRGVGVPYCIHSGEMAAEKIVKDL
ncbi:MAG: protoporphyrinogen oxidase [Lentisphaerae bacterium]|nr:protoporphyrinogen oxidase [Lentisphaerota bacterium]